ncbi:hypothetical protein GCM10008934_11410 [Virgibacillus salarius]
MCSNKNRSVRNNNCVKWVVNEYRRDKRTGPLSPISRSNYAQLLFEKGAGFHEQGTNREYVKRLSLDD